MTRIKLIVGLNNNDIKYNLTRHNAGAWYINMLSHYFNVSLKNDKKNSGHFAVIHVGTEKIYLFIPNAYMNCNGDPIFNICNFYKINTEQILVAHDEIYLPCGTAKFKYKGGDGGHNGLKNIISKLKKNNFYRLRIGIGFPENNEKIVNFVLSKPNINQKKLIDQAINEALQCTSILLKENIFTAMNRLHSFKAL